MDEQEQTIDLRVLLRVLLEHWIPIVIAGILAAAIGFSLAAFVIPKRYSSEALMYVENSSASDKDSLNINDLNVALKLVNTCEILFKSNDVLDQLSERFNGEYTASKLGDMITVDPVDNTEVLKITVVAGDPQLAHDVAAEEVDLATVEYHRVIKSGSIETVSQPTMPKSHTYPSTTRFALIGGAAGLVVLYLFFLVKELLDIKVKPDDDLAQIYDIPVFAEILDFEMAGKGGYKYSKYGYGKYGYKYSNYGAYDEDNQKEDEAFADGYDKAAEDNVDENDDDDDEFVTAKKEKKNGTGDKKDKKNDKKNEKESDALKETDKDKTEGKEEKKEVKAKNGEKKK